MELYPGLKKFVRKSVTSIRNFRFFRPSGSKATKYDWNIFRNFGQLIVLVRSSSLTSICNTSIIQILFVCQTYVSAKVLIIRKRRIATDTIPVYPVWMVDQFIAVGFWFKNLDKTKTHLFFQKFLFFLTISYNLEDSKTPSLSQDGNDFLDATVVLFHIESVNDFA